MADVRCPMCGKPNPAESDTCQYCQARLKPLIAGSSPASSSDVPDWLSGLRDEQGNELGSGETAGAQDDSLDWLARLGEAAGGETPAPASSDVPDWMSGLGDTEATTAFQKPDFDAEDFLAQEPAGSGESPTEFSQFSSQDWFTESAEAPEETAGVSDAAPTDWFSQQAEQGLPETNLNDWFADSGGQSQTPGEAEVEPEAPVREESAPFSADFFSAPEAEKTADEPTAQFDWQAGGEPLGDLDSLEIETPQVEPQPAEGMPDWLNWEPTHETPATESGLPDWLSAAPDTQPDAGAPAEAASAWDSEWLSGGTSIPNAGDAATVISPFTTMDDDDSASTAAFGLESDWSAGGLGEPAQPAPAAAVPESDEPDWLSSLTAPESGAQAAPQPAGSGAFGEDEISSAASIFSDWGGSQQQPDWLSQREDAEAGESQASGVPAFAFDDGGEVSEPTEHPLGATPDWMSQVSAEDAAAIPAFQASVEEAPRDEETLERANLPGWLEAMRPVDAIALEDFKDTSDERVETVGPLAGLRGALPVGIETNKVAAVPAHGLKLNISEETHSRVNLLTEMLKAETQPRQAAAGVEFMSGALIRLVLFVVLMLAAIWALWYGEQPGTISLQNSPLPPAAADFQQRLSMLPPEPVVLVAVESEVAFTGEMDAAAEALLTFLAARRAQIYFVSTNPMGPILTEHYIQGLDQQPARGNIPYALYNNLGFLSGGPAGLISFLNAPERSTTFDLAGQPAWETISGLSSKGLERFSAVIVLTASSETARLWIEQAGPLLQDRAIPLLFGVSAQVNPILQPYYQAVPRQVDGILSGLPEIYRFIKSNGLDQLSGQPSLAQKQIDAYSAVVLAAVLVLLIGIVVNLISHLLPARAKERKA